MTGQKIAEYIAVLWVGFGRCGKGTQTGRLRALGHPVFETGSELREAAQREPTNKALDPVRTGGLVTSEIVNWTAKQWLMRLIMSKAKRNVIHFDGLPRKVGQLDQIQFFRERGYKVCCVWFTTPPEVCNTRPPRADRAEDIDPIILGERKNAWEQDTLPILELLPKYGVSIDKGNLLLIDNTELTKYHVAEQVIQFLHLPFTVKDMFPEFTGHVPTNAHGATARSCEPGSVHRIPNQDLVLANMAERYKIDPSLRPGL